MSTDFDSYMKKYAGKGERETKTPAVDTSDGREQNRKKYYVSGYNTAQNAYVPIADLNAATNGSGIDPKIKYYADYYGNGGAAAQQAQSRQWYGVPVGNAGALSANGNGGLSFGEGLEYVGANAWLGAQETAQNLINDVAYKAQANAPEDIAWNAVEADRANGGAEARAAQEEFLAALTRNKRDALEITGQIPSGEELLFQKKFKEAEEQLAVNEDGGSKLVKAAHFADKTAQKIADKYGDVEGTWATAGRVAQSVGGQLPAIALRIIPGGAIFADALLYASASGGATEQALSEGKSTARAVSYGSASGLLELATEKMFDGLGGALGAGAMDDITESALSSVDDTLARNALRFLIGINEEGLEEVISDIADPFVRAYTTGTNLSDELNNVTVRDLWESYKMGALSAAVMSGGSLGLHRAGKAAGLIAATQYDLKNAAIESEQVQKALADFKKTKTGKDLQSYWNAIGEANSNAEIAVAMVKAARTANRAAENTLIQNGITEGTDMAREFGVTTADINAIRITTGANTNEKIRTFLSLVSKAATEQGNRVSAANTAMQTGDGIQGANSAQADPTLSRGLTAKNDLSMQTEPRSADARTAETTELTAEEYDQRIEALERIRKSQKTVEGLAKAIGSSPEEVRNYINRNDFRNVFALARVMQQHEATSLDELDRSFEEDYGDYRKNSQEFDEKSLQFSENGDTLPNENSWISENPAEEILPPEGQNEEERFSALSEQPVSTAGKAVVSEEWLNEREQQAVQSGFGPDSFSHKNKILHGVRTQKLKYVKRDPLLRLSMRGQYPSRRRNFLKDLGLNHSDELRENDFSEDQIEMIAKGKPPSGYSVHHILPLDDGGENIPANFVLIDNESHKVMTSYQRSFCHKLQANDSLEVEWAFFVGNIYNRAPEIK